MNSESPLLRNKHQTAHEQGQIENEENNQEFSLFRHKYKEHQMLLKSKFKTYLERNQAIYPFVNQRSATEVMEEYIHDDIPNTKTIRREKEFLMTDLQQNINNYHYLETKRNSNLKTFYLIKNKFDRITDIRDKRKMEVKNLEKTKKQIEEEIRNEKIKYKRSVDISKERCILSRAYCEQRKMKTASVMKMIKESHKYQIQNERDSLIQKNRLRHSQIKKQQERIHIKVSQVVQNNRTKANDSRLEKLFREIAEKQEIKIVSSRVKQKISGRMNKLIQNAQLYQSRIHEFRRYLGEDHVSNQVSRSVQINKSDDVHTKTLRKSDLILNFNRQSTTYQ